MTEHLKPKTLSLLTILSRSSSTITILIGLAVLAGWISDVTFLKSIFSDLVSMKANTAFCFVLSGISLWMLTTERHFGWRYHMGQVCSGCIVLIGVLTLCEYFFVWDLGIDQFLVNERVPAFGTSHAGRMAPNAALNFVLLGVGFLCFNVRNQWAQWIAQISASAVGLISLAALLGYMYRLPSLYGFLNYTRIAVHAAVTFFIVFIGLMAAQPKWKITQIVTNDTLGGIMARRLLFPVILMQVILASLRMQGEWMGLYDTEFGTSMMAVISIIISVILILWNSQLIFKLDLERLQAEEMKNDFISIVTHELKVPLTSIRASIGLIMDEVADNVSNQIKGLFNIANANSERLLRLINDLLDIQKVESGKMDFDMQPFEIMPLIHQTVEMNHAYGDQFKVQFVVKNSLHGVRVNADCDRLIQVLTNLLSNAAKFSPPDSTVEISVMTHNQKVRIEVTDHGSGIPEKFRSRIFQKFVQADASSQVRKQGTGLGLSICKMMVEKMNGKIDFKTEINAGTTFYFDLPIVSG